MINPISFNGRVYSRIQYNNTNPTYDSFTGLKDKNTLLQDIERRMYKKEDISMGMFDMDNFKSINELLGYKVGDEFIKAISEDISTVAKKQGVDAYRFGGDEFVVILFNEMDKNEKLEIIDDIINSVAHNPIIASRSSEYMENADKKLSIYEESNDKIRNLLTLNTQRNTLYDIFSHGTIAATDPYVQRKLSDTDLSFQNLYNSLAQGCIADEKDPVAKKALKGEISQGIEYLINKYDRNHEIYRLKKWVKDFSNNGFNITGGVAIFKPSFYKGKQPIDIVNEVGEYLKESKINGDKYFVEVK